MIGIPPAGGAFIVGTSPSLRAEAYYGTAFRWTRNGDTVEGAASAELKLTNLQPAAAGSYRLTVSNAAGSTQSDAALVETVERAGVVAVAAAEGWSFWLRSDGLLFYGGLDPRHPAYPLTHWATREAPILLARDVVRVAAAEYQAFYITQDGKLWAWGSNAYGQLGDGTQERRNTPVPVADGVVAVTAGRDHTLFIKNDGTLWGMGRNHQGQLGDGTRIDRHRAVRLAFDVTAASAGLEHSAMIKSDGTLWTVGSGVRGALADGQTVSRGLWRQVATEVQAVRAGSAQTYALKRDGSLWAAGANLFGQLGDGTTIDRATLVQVASDVESVSSQASVTIFVKRDGSLWNIGGNNFLFSAQASSRVPVKVSDGTFVTAALSSGHALLIDRAGTAFALGGNAVGSLGLGHRNQVTQPTAVTGGPLAAPSGVVDLAVGMPVRGDGVVLRWKHPLGAERFEVWRSSTNDPATATRIAQGVENASYVDFTAADGALYYYWVTASNAQGTSVLAGGGSGRTGSIPPPTIVTGPAEQALQVGQALLLSVEAEGAGPLFYQWTKNGVPIEGAIAAHFHIASLTEADAGDYAVTVTNPAGRVVSATARVSIVGPPAVVAVAVGSAHSLMLRSDGSLWAMGGNWAGQLGIGSTARTSPATRVADDVIDLKASGVVSFFLKRDGTLWSAGGNSYGELGDGTTQSRISPVMVMSEVEQVVSNGSTTLILRRDGSLWGAGYGEFSFVSIFPRTSTPVQLLSDVREVAIGPTHMVVVKRDGTLWGAGKNYYGQLGPGATFGWAEFTRIAEGVRSVAAGYSHTAFLRLDGTLWSLGANDAGQLGDGTSIARTTPVLTARDVVSAHAGDFRTVFAKADGSLWLTGRDFSEPAASRLVPVQIEAAAVAAALSFHGLIVRSDGRLIGLGDNSWGQLGTRDDEGAVAGFTGLFRVPQAVTGLEQRAEGASGVVDLRWAVADGATSYEVWASHSSDVTTATRVAERVPVARYRHHPSDQLPTYYWVRALSPAGASPYGSPLRASPPAAIAPAVVTPPTAVRSYIGLSATLSVVASGSKPLRYQWSRNGQPIAGATQETLTIANAQESDSGQYSVRVSNAAGAVESSSATVSIAQLPGAVRVVAGAFHSLILGTDGSLWAMGNSGYGQIPDAGAGTKAFRPVLIDRDVVALAAGEAHTHYVTRDGKLWGVGRNSSGQLGDGNKTNTATPVQVASGVRRVAAGGSTSFIIKSDGTLWASGSGELGQFGNGSTASVATALQVSAAPVVAVATSGRHSLQIRSDGSVWASGSNRSGELGDGTTENRSAAVKVWEGSVVAPAAPTALTATDGTLDHGVRLNWEASLGAVEYEVWRADTPAFAAATRLARGVELPLYLDVPPVRGVRYYYWIKAENAAGQSLPSAVAGGVMATAIAPRIVASPQDQIGSGPYDHASFTVEATGTAPLTYQWRVNGTVVVAQDYVSGEGTRTLSIRYGGRFRTGMVDVVVSNAAGSATSQPARLVLLAPGWTSGSSPAGANIVHPNGNVYDQYLVTTSDAMVRADPGQVVRLSYVDLTDDIVQVEFAGAGVLTLALESATGPAQPANYNQAVNYMKGHARIVVAGADETTNLTVFSVGRMTAFDPSGAFDVSKPSGGTNDPARNGNPIFKSGVSYDGHADIASISILSANGKFGGLRTSNATYFATAGLTGVYAPGVTFTGPVFVGDISASDAAQPVLRLGAASDVRITGGDLTQANGTAVDISGIARLRFTPGQDSHGRALPAQANKAKLTENGVDVTSQIAAAPGS